MISALVVFAICYALDFVWVFYTKAVADHRRVPATWWSACIMLITGLNIGEIATNWYLVIPAAAGAALGTYHALGGNDGHKS